MNEDIWVHSPFLIEKVNMFEKIVLKKELKQSDLLYNKTRGAKIPFTSQCIILQEKSPSLWWVLKLNSWPWPRMMMMLLYLSITHAYVSDLFWLELEKSHIRPEITFTLKKVLMSSKIFFLIKILKYDRKLKKLQLFDKIRFQLRR